MGVGDNATGQVIDIPAVRFKEAKMGEPPELEKFSIVRDTSKAFLTFLAVLTATQVLSGFSGLVEQMRLKIYAAWWALPLLFVGFWAVFLVGECILRAQRRSINSVIHGEAPGDGCDHDG